MAIEKNTVLTPNKKDSLIDIIKEELIAVGNSIKEKKYGEAAILSLKRNQDSLQTYLNKLLEKKGVVTPSETNDILDSLNSAKKTRLEQELSKTKKRTIYLTIGVFLLVGVFITLKKIKK